MPKREICAQISQEFHAKLFAKFHKKDLQNFLRALYSDYQSNGALMIT